MESIDVFPCCGQQLSGLICVALVTGISHTAFNKKLANARSWKAEELVHLSEFFNVSVEYLVGRLPIESAAPSHNATSLAAIAARDGVGRAGLEPATDGL